MTQDPRLRVDSLGAASPRHVQQDPSQDPPSARSIQPGMQDILRTLAAHGAGAGSTELAFDLVLHEIVEEARETTQATGAAIAWMRDGEMVCRATTGINAPNLGVRVDIGSGLAGACNETGQIQTCRDTDTDSRVNAEACRQLGVRSMLFAPISMAHKTVGILQLYSSSPYAFDANEILAAKLFVSRSIEAWIEAQSGDQGSWEDAGGSNVTGDDRADDGYAIRGTEDEITLTPNLPSRSRMNEFSNSILLIAVLGVAIVLGLVLGWRWGREQVLGTSGPGAAPISPIAVATDPESSSQTATGSSSSNTAIRTGVVTQDGGTVPNGTSPGGLVISQDGKVIYRSIEQPTIAAQYPPPVREGTKLLRRVDPEYPSAAFAQHVQGPVVLDVEVMENGTVAEVVVRSGDPLLTKAAVDAVRQWRFQSSGDGRAVDRQTRVTINFTLPAK
jgi:TonB family protein